MCIRSSKTDRTGETYTRKFTRTGERLCPVLIAAWLKFGASQNKEFHDENLLKVRDGGGRKETVEAIKGSICLFTSPPVSYHLVNKILLSTSKEMGFERDIWTSHSLRAGGATALYLQGYHTASIQKMGRWKSDSVFFYVNHILGQESEVARNMMRPREEREPTQIQDQYEDRVEELEILWNLRRLS